MQTLALSVTVNANQATNISILKVVSSSMIRITNARIYLAVSSVILLDSSVSNAEMAMIKYGYMEITLHPTFLSYIVANASSQKLRIIMNALSVMTPAQ
jgi:hypothetical protein